MIISCILFVLTVALYLASKKNTNKPILKLASIGGTIATVLSITLTLILSPDATQKRISHRHQSDIYFFEEIQNHARSTLKKAIVFTDKKNTPEEITELKNILQGCSEIHWVCTNVDKLSAIDIVNQTTEDYPSIKNIIFVDDLTNSEGKNEKPDFIKQINNYNVFIRSNIGILYNYRQELKFVMTARGVEAFDPDIAPSESYKVLIAQ